MFWRFLLVLLKSALLVALFELLSPFVDAVGFQLRFVASLAKAISQAAAVPYREAELLLLLVLSATLLKIGKIGWDIVRRAFDTGVRYGKH